ncbi:MAG: DUF4340 domain-containing protein [Verrucomicrobia bacterium]|nr:DUF4340 domain-containing protein [Verrucomicrobiota bacterium]
MMKWRNTWLLVAGTVGLFGFIALYERHTGPTTPAVAPPSRLLPSLKTADATGVQVRRTNQFVVRAERAAASWRLTAPLVYPAAPVAVERLLLALERAVAPTHLTPRDLAGRRQKPADFGLETPQAVVLVEQGSERHELVFGALTPPGDQVYVQEVGSPDISVVDAAVLQLLPQSVNDWRNLALLEFSGFEFDRLEVAKGGGGLFLQFDATNQLWHLSRPRQRADQAKVEGLLETLVQARVTQFVTDDPKADLDSFGLQPPQLEVALGRGTNQSQRVQFGKGPVGDTTNVYARRLNQTNVVLVPKALLETLGTPAAEYRDRRLLAFQPASVTVIEVRGEEPFTLRRLTNGNWVAGETTLVDGPFVRDWLQGLSQLQVSEFVKDVVTDFSNYGLAPPRRQYLLRTTVTNAAGVTNLLLGEIQFGTNTAERVFVHRADEDSVYAIPFADYYRMPAESWQLRDRRVWNFSTNQVTRVTARHSGASRTLLRTANHEWELAPGSPGFYQPNSFALEEIMFRLGELQATVWCARGKETLPRYGFAELNLQVIVELKLGEKVQRLTMDFGGPTPGRFPYAATTIEGQVWVFEFPFFLYQDMVRAFGLPLIPSPQERRREGASRFAVPPNLEATFGSCPVPHAVPVGRAYSRAEDLAQGAAREYARPTRRTSFPFPRKTDPLRVGRIPI